MTNFQLRFVAESRNGDEGSTILELLIAVLIIALAFVGVANLSAVQNRALISTNDLTTAQSQIDADVAAVRNLAETYTWCSGTGGFSGTATNCAGASARTENYYFPTAAASSAIYDFESACRNNILNDPPSSTATSSLVKAINALALPSLVTARTVSNDDIAANRLRITYTTAASTGVGRTVVLTPVVAAWCP